MRLVVDTDVLVSGLLTPGGPPARLVDLIVDGQVHLLIDDRILDEYRRVLTRGRFGFNPDDVAALLRFVELSAESVTAARIRFALPDASDRPFLEVAISGGADALVTGNLRHYPAAATRAISVVTPASLVRRLEGP